MRNYFCSASYRKIVGADFISARYNIVVLSHKNTVGDGSPVPRRKAFSDEFGVISVTQITSRYFTINKCPYFHRINPLKIGTFCFCDIFVQRKSLRDSGRTTRPLQKFCLKTGGYKIRPYGIQVFRDKYAEQK